MRMPREENYNPEDDMDEEELRAYRERREKRLQRQREQAKKARNQAIAMLAAAAILVVGLVTGVLLLISKEKNGKDPEADKLTLKPNEEQELQEEEPQNPGESLQPEQNAASENEADPLQEDPSQEEAGNPNGPYIQGSVEVPEGYVTIPEGYPGNVSASIYIPSWITQDFLTVSDMNRPGTALTSVKNIVVHYVANPGSSAKANRDYFEDLANPIANPAGTRASAHFVVGLQGEIVQCVPVEEISWANYPRNEDTISIEVCHPDWSGEFTETTYWALVRLTAWLCEQYGLTFEDVIRHYDVSGKECPVYYVQNPEMWTQFKGSVAQYMAQYPDIGTQFP